MRSLNIKSHSRYLNCKCPKSRWMKNGLRRFIYTVDFCKWTKTYNSEIIFHKLQNDPMLSLSKNIFLKITKLMSFPCFFKMWFKVAPWGDTLVHRLYPEKKHSHHTIWRKNVLDSVAAHLRDPIKILTFENPHFIFSVEHKIC